MGKALVVMVMGVGLYMAIGQLSTQETLNATAARQAEYQQEVVAREIARSGFNMAMAIARRNGSHLQDAIEEINTDIGYMTGEHQGGTYAVRAWLTDGFSITIESTGEFGEADYTMKDSYRVPVLLVARCSTLDVRFLESEAGYCSAIFLQRHPAGASADQIPAPEMIFSAGRNTDNVGVAVDKILAQGTQMNFMIGVDKNCSTRPSVPSTYDVNSHVFNPADYDHVHTALDVPYGFPELLQESNWAFVEQHRVATQKWRIAWEDLHYPQWDAPLSENPQQSLQALKRLGYDGLGWPDQDEFGYRELRDYWIRSGYPNNGQSTSYRPDFSDQVIELWLTPIEPENSGGICEGGEEPPPPGGGDPPPPPGDGDPPPDPDPDPMPDPEPCACPTDNPDRFYAVMHRPVSNPSNESIKCVTSGGLNLHLSNHNDYLVCQGD